MELYIADINKIELNRKDELYGDRASKFERFKNIDDKKRCLAGGLLINKFLKNKKIFVNQYGKPYAENGRFFNISHSGDYVLFALSGSEVGCDIQKSHRLKNFERISKLVFCKNEMDYLQGTSDKQSAFFDLWTKKESLLKCIGKGFYRNADSVDVSAEIFYEGNISYHFKLWHIFDYSIAVCTTEDNFPNEIKFISL